MGSFEKFGFGAAVSAVDCRNGGFWAFDDDVPPGVKFQNTPTPPRTMVRPVPKSVVGEAEPRADVALRVGLQVAADLHAAHGRVVGGDHELAGGHVEVRLTVVDLHPGHVHLVAQAEVQRQLGVDAEVVLQVDGVLGPLLGVGLRVEQVAGLGGGVAEEEARHVEACAAVDRAAHGLARAVRGHVVVEAEVADDGVGVQDLARAEGHAAAQLERVLALDPRDVVEDLEVVLVGDQRLVARSLPGCGCSGSSSGSSPRSSR